MSDILKALKFVRGAISKRDSLPSMKHFLIENGTVTAFNGILTLSSPIDIDLSCCPRAEEMFRAIERCEDAVSLTLTSSNRLVIRSGKFRASVDCDPDAERGMSGAYPTPATFADGERYELPENFIDYLDLVHPFIATDASRLHFCGALMRADSLFATNNACVIERWIGKQTFPVDVTIPGPAIAEILRLGVGPLSARLTNRSIAFEYEDGKWIKSQLLTQPWPELSSVLDLPAAYGPNDESLFVGLKTLKPFCDEYGHIFGNGNVIRTHRDENAGASYTMDFLAFDGAYNIDMLGKLKCASQVDFAEFPRPALFAGDGFRGAVAGMRL